MQMPGGGPPPLTGEGAERQRDREKAAFCGFVVGLLAGGVLWPIVMSLFGWI